MVQTICINIRTHLMSCVEIKIAHNFARAQFCALVGIWLFLLFDLNSATNRWIEFLCPLTDLPAYVIIMISIKIIRSFISFTTQQFYF